MALAEINYPYLRYAGAILLAPAIGCAIIAASLSAYMVTHILYFPESFISILVGGLLFAYPAMLFVGIPVLIIFRALNLNHVFHYALAGALAGLIITSVIISIGALFDPFIIFMTSLSGAVCASVSWAFLFLKFKRSTK